MKNRMVWVEEDDLFRAVRIFKSRKAAYASNTRISLMLRAVAVFHIRRQIWIRSNGMCELCTSVVTETSGHMHEQQHRGKGGEISLDNSVFICPKCHQDAHSDRTPQWSKKI